MSEETKIIIEQALGLSLQDREQLFRALRHSLSKDESEIETAFFDEGEERFAAYQHGEVSAHDLDEIKSRREAYLKGDLQGRDFDEVLRELSAK